MAWESTKWACGHSGDMQLYGKHSGRDSAVAVAVGRDCMACWLVGEWEKTNDPRSKREDRYILAGKIAEGKGKRIFGLPESVPAKKQQVDVVNLLAALSTSDLVAEINRRRTAGEEIEA